MEVAAENMGAAELNTVFDLPLPLEPRTSRFSPERIVGFAIVSKDGMLANAAGVMPESLKFEADKKFFENGLDGVDVVVHGRHSHEQQPRSFMRKRLHGTRIKSASCAA
jgi:hypothetical protein